MLGRLGVTHRDVPEMIARGYAEVGLTQYHLISYWVRTFPNHFELVPIEGAERFSVKIAFGRVIDPLRPRARDAFEYHILSDLQTPTERADNFGWYAVEGNLAYAPGVNGDAGAYFTAAKSLTPAFVADVVTRYLSKPPVSVTLVPQTETPKGKTEGAVEQ